MTRQKKVRTSVTDKLLATHLMASMAAMAVMLALGIVPHASLLGVVGHVVLVVVSPALLPVMWFGSIIDVLELPASDPAVHAWLACSVIYMALFSGILHKVSRKTR